MEVDPYTICGLTGTGCYIVAYVAVVQGWMQAGGWRFPALNLAGALLVLVSLASAWNLPSVLLEWFWAMISLYGVVRGIRRRFASPSGSG